MCGPWHVNRTLTCRSVRPIESRAMINAPLIEQRLELKKGPLSHRDVRGVWYNYVVHCAVCYRTDGIIRKNVLASAIIRLRTSEIRISHALRDIRINILKEISQWTLLLFHPDEEHRPWKFLKSAVLHFSMHRNVRSICFFAIMERAMRHGKTKTRGWELFRKL